MRYTMQSTKYVLKNFIYLLPFAIIPAILLSISTDEEAIYYVVKALLEGEVETWTFVSIFRAISILNFATPKSIVFGVISIVVIIPCVAMLMALMEKHMRIGKRTYHGLWRRLNNNLISTFIGVVLLLALYEIWSFLIAVGLYFASRISILWLAYAVSALAFLLLHALLMLAITAIYLWLPCMQITGFRAKEALVYSYRIMGDIKWRIFLVQMFVLLFVEAIISACTLLITNYLVYSVIVTIIYSAVIMIFCVRMQIAYFDRDHIERADTAKYYQR